MPQLFRENGQTRLYDKLHVRAPTVGPTTVLTSSTCILHSARSSSGLCSRGSGAFLVMALRTCHDDNVKL